MQPVAVVDSLTAKVPLVIGQERITAKTTAVEAETGVEIARGIGCSVVITKIVMVVARTYKEMHADTAKVDHARG